MRPGYHRGLILRDAAKTPLLRDEGIERKRKEAMLAFILRRAIQAIAVMIVVGVVAFSMFRFAGDPVNQMVSIDTSAAQRAEIRKSLGLDDPVLVQFAHYFANAAQFKF